MNDKQKIRIGRKLSLVLRHNPAAIGISLDEKGWADVEELIPKMNASGSRLTLAELTDIVLTNDKQRYRFSEDGTKIRANQGHSLTEVDLELQPTEPPPTLFHGTAIRFLSSIFESGLESRSRQHVHLSDNLETASQVGKRHGKLVILSVNAAAMLADGFIFYRSHNGVWLISHVPHKYIKQGE